MLYVPQTVLHEKANYELMTNAYHIHGPVNRLHIERTHKNDRKISQLKKLAKSINRCS